MFPSLDLPVRPALLALRVMTALPAQQVQPETPALQAHRVTTVPRAIPDALAKQATRLWSCQPRSKQFAANQAFGQAQTKMPPVISA